jgi:hypothetical protein
MARNEPHCHLVALITQLIGEGHFDFLLAAAFPALMTRARPGSDSTGVRPDAEFADRHTMCRGQTELLARHLACIVSWLTGAADFGPNGVDSA